MIITDFFLFLQKKDTARTIKRKRNIFRDILLLFLFLKFSTYFYIKVLDTIFELPVQKIISQTSNFNRLILTGVLLAPLIEELTCRLALIYKRSNLSISAGLLFSLIFISIFHIKLLSYLGFFLIFSVPALIYIILDYNKEKSDPLLQNLWNKHFYLIFYLSSIIFTFLHISNYKIDSFKQGILIPLLLVTYFFTGLILGYIRVKFGFFWSWFTHVLNNLLSVLIILLI